MSEPGEARRSQEELGEARRSKGEPGGAGRSPEDPGEPRKRLLVGYAEGLRKGTTDLVVLASKVLLGASWSSAGTS